MFLEHQESVFALCCKGTKRLLSFSMSRYDNDQWVWFKLSYSHHLVTWSRLNQEHQIPAGYRFIYSSCFISTLKHHLSVSAHDCSCYSVKLSSSLSFTHIFPESLRREMHDVAFWKHLKKRLKLFTAYYFISIIMFWNYSKRFLKFRPLFRTIYLIKYDFRNRLFCQ